MFDREHRLCKQGDIKRVLRSRSSYPTPLFVLKDTRNTMGIRRFCFIVSTKVAKRATDRNRMRRRLREAFRTHGNALPDKRDYVIIARIGSLTAPYSRILDLVQRTASRL